MVKKKVSFHNLEAWPHIRYNHSKIFRNRLRTGISFTLYVLFLNLEMSLAGQKLESNEEVIAATDAFFEDGLYTCNWGIMWLSESS